MCLRARVLCCVIQWISRPVHFLKLYYITFLPYLLPRHLRAIQIKHTQLFQAFLKQKKESSKRDSFRTKHYSDIGLRCCIYLSISVRLSFVYNFRKIFSNKKNAKSKKILAIWQKPRTNSLGCVVCLCDFYFLSFCVYIVEPCVFSLSCSWGREMATHTAGRLF